MGFKKLKGFGVSIKVSWMLSEYAVSVITSDWYEYDQQQRNDQKLRNDKGTIPSKIFNQTFLNYHEYAFCSTPPEFTDNITDEQKSAVYKSMFSVIKKRYLSDKGIKQNYRFSGDTIKAIEDYNQKNDIAEIYSQKQAWYFRAVLEEYALLPKFEREKYLYIDKYREIQNQLTKNDASDNAIVVSHYTSKPDGAPEVIESLIYPYKLIPGRALLHYYLVGIGRPQKNKDKPFGLYTIRLTTIERVEKMSLGEQRISPEELKKKKSELIETLEKIDVPYINSKYFDDIKVKFTEKGLGLLHRIMHNRPKYKMSDEDNYICHFSCTELEILNYLHSFGGDAVVLSPGRIRKKMYEFYDNAKNRYEFYDNAKKMYDSVT